MKNEKPLWIPDESTIANANLTKYMSWLAGKGHRFSDYQSLWSWSVQEPSQFWKTMVEYFDIQFDGTAANVLNDQEMPYAKWFQGMSVSYAEHVFRMSTDAWPAVISGSESSPIKEISWTQLMSEVAALSTFMRSEGIKPGDRVAAYLPCIPHATVGFLSANSIGAVWASCSPDFGLQSVLDRFAQIEPKIIIASTAYAYGGKQFDKAEVIKELVIQIPSVKKVILIDRSAPLAGDKYISWDSATSNGEAQLDFTRVPF